MAKQFKFEELKEQYIDLIETMEIKDSWKSAVFRRAKAIRANKDKYVRVSELAGGSIPWYFIGVIHSLECGLDFTKHLHNGDSLARRTKRVPANRPKSGNGPFTFEESAVDALQMKGFHKIDDWSLARAAYELERYNGWGYRYGKSRPLSPYLWSGTNHYTKGKFVSDGKYSASAVSKQIGVMPLILALITLEEETTDVSVVKRGSRRIRFQDRLDAFIKWTGLGGLLSFGTLEQVRGFVQDYAGFLLLGTGVIVWLGIKYIQFRSQEEVKEGRYIPSKRVK